MSSGQNDYDKLYVVKNQKELTPLNKLIILATQLGESCPIADLGAIINQKRDMELEKITKEKVEEMRSQKSKERFDEKKKYITSLTHQQQAHPHHGTEEKKSKSVNNKKDLSETISKSAMKLETINTVNNLNDSKNYLKIREILANFILSCIKEFTIDELYLIKINYNLIYCFLSLPSLDNIRSKNFKKKLDNMDYLLNKEEDYSILELRGVISMGGTNILDSHRETTQSKGSQGSYPEDCKNIRKNSSRTSNYITIMIFIYYNYKYLIY